MREVSKQFSKKTKSGTIAAAAAAKSLQSCPTLCDPMDSSPPGSPVHGILQARTLEWVAISLSGTIAIYQEIGCGMWFCDLNSTFSFDSTIAVYQEIGSGVWFYELNSTFSFEVTYTNKKTCI